MYNSSFTKSLSGKLSFNFQRVNCGNQYFLIVETVEDRKVIYGEIHTNGYCYFPSGKIYWEQDQNGEDILVDDRMYVFLERDGLLTLMSPLPSTFIVIPFGFTNSLAICINISR